MITLYSYDTLGHADHGWLDARHHFSFASYRNPLRTHFGVLRVINDDRIAAGAGFDPHPHQNMEIITYVRKGAISHRDSLGNVGRTEAGNVQVMSAGTGVTHAEYNEEAEETRLYQLWIEPREDGVTPRWDMAVFPETQKSDSLQLLVSGYAEDEGKGALYIHQDAAIYGGRLKAGATLTQAIRNQAYILVSYGEVTLNNVAAKQGDGAELTGEQQLSITALTDAEILVIDVPSRA